MARLRKGSVKACQRLGTNSRLAVSSRALGINLVFETRDVFSMIYTMNIKHGLLENRLRRVRVLYVTRQPSRMINSRDCPLTPIIV